MSKKRRRPPSGSSRPGGRSSPKAPKPTQAATGTGGTKRTRGDARRTTSPDGAAAKRGRATDQQEERRPAPIVAHPPVGISLARGIGTVLTSPPLMISSLLAALALWAVFATYGVLLAATPGVMALLESPPPVHSFFLDLRLVAGGASRSGVAAAASALGLLAIRSFLLGFWMALLADGVRGTRRPWREAVRHAAGAATRSFRTLFGIEAGSLVLALVALFISLGFLGAGLGQLAVLGALVGSLYFFAFMPVVATLEGGGLRWVARTSIRAARIPGPRHMLFVTLIVAFALFVSTLTPGSRVAEATPSIAVWSYVLFVGLLHLGMLGSLVYRWVHVRETVLAETTPEPDAPSRVEHTG